MIKSANVGSVDRTLRLIIGAVLILLPFLSTSTLWSGTVMTWLIPIIGAILIGTAFLRFCPLYKIIGTSTCKTE